MEMITVTVVHEDRLALTKIKQNFYQVSTGHSRIHMVTESYDVTGRHTGTQVDHPVGFKPRTCYLVGGTTLGDWIACIQRAEEAHKNHAYDTHTREI